MAEISCCCCWRGSRCRRRSRCTSSTSATRACPNSTARRATLRATARATPRQCERCGPALALPETLLRCQKPCCAARIPAALPETLLRCQNPSCAARNPPALPESLLLYQKPSRCCAGTGGAVSHPISSGLPRGGPHRQSEAHGAQAFAAPRRLPRHLLRNATCWFCIALLWLACAVGWGAHTAGQRGLKAEIRSGAKGHAPRAG